MILTAFVAFKALSSTTYLQSPALGKLRQDGGQFQNSPGSIAKHYLNGKERGKYSVTMMHTVGFPGLATCSLNNFIFIFSVTLLENFKWKCKSDVYLQILILSHTKIFWAFWFYFIFIYYYLKDLTNLEAPSLSRLAGSPLTSTIDLCATVSGFYVDTRNPN